MSLDDYQITIHGTKSKPVDYESVISDELSDSHQTKLEAGQFNFKTVFFVIFIFNLVFFIYILKNAINLGIFTFSLSQIKMNSCIIISCLFFGLFIIMFIILLGEEFWDFLISDLKNVFLI